jgi:hypothetical protein
MDSLDTQLVYTLRSMARQGDQPSALLRMIIAHLAPVTVDRLLLVGYFSMAFSFIEGQGHPIFGWFPDGSGELKDSDIDRIMWKRIQQTRPEWDRPFIASEETDTVHANAAKRSG